MWILTLKKHSWNAAWRGWIFLKHLRWHELLKCLNWSAGTKCKKLNLWGWIDFPFESIVTTVRIKLNILNISNDIWRLNGCWNLEKIWNILIFWCLNEVSTWKYEWAVIFWKFLKFWTFSHLLWMGNFCRNISKFCKFFKILNRGSNFLNFMNILNFERFEYVEVCWRS